MAGNKEFQDSFGISEVEHFSKTDSDHEPRLPSCGVKSPQISKTFQISQAMDWKRGFHGSG